MSTPFVLTQGEVQRRLQQGHEILAHATKLAANMEQSTGAMVEASWQGQAATGHGQQMGHHIEVCNTVVRGMGQALQTCHEHANVHVGADTA